MTAVWIPLFVCTSSLPSSSQGDVSVANQSYTSSEECYAEGAKRARGASLSALKEGKRRPAGYGKATFGGHSRHQLLAKAAIASSRVAA
jgi:hypothetical protein